MLAIETRGLSKSYGPVRALRGVSFEIERGEVIGLLGPNGAGKTTLMKILTGYIQPDEGVARMNGVDVVDDPLTVQSRIGYLPEAAPLYYEMRVHEYLAMIAELRGVPQEKQTSHIAEAVEATGLGEYFARPIHALSKGYKQRVGIAQAILHKPDLLILDEPTSGLDPTQIVEIRDLIKRLAERSTVMLSTHILPEVEMTCERVLIIIRGQLRLDSALSELRESQSSGAIVAIDKNADGVEKKLGAISGVGSVTCIDDGGDFKRWRVSAEKAETLCPQIFDALRTTDWRIAELRPEVHNLETVFRALARSTEEAERSEGDNEERAA